MAKASETALKTAIEASEKRVKKSKTAGKKTAGKTAGSKKSMKSMKAMKAKNAEDEMFHVRIPVKSKVDHVWIHTNLG
jgi:hypothetical protein